MIKTLLVMAAGMGSRFGGLKQAAGIGPSGETLLEYSIYDALRAGFEKCVFVIRRDMEASFKKEVLSRFEGKVDVSIVYQEMDRLPDGFSPPNARTKPWGTGHAVLCAKEAIDQPFAVINADDYYGPQAFELLAQWMCTQAAPDRFGMVGYRLSHTLSEHGTVSRGLCELGEQDDLRGIEETHGIAQKNGQYECEHSQLQLSGEEWVSLNLWGFHPELFALLEKDFTAFLTKHINEPKSEFYLPACVDLAMKSGQVSVDLLKSKDHWFGVTYREDLERVQAALRSKIESNVYPSALWA